MAINLSGIKLKLERAEQHRVELMSLADQFVADNPYSFAREFKPELSGFAICAKVVKDPPPILGIIVGDAVHNLRSALDHLACPFVLDSGSKPHRGTAFPVCLKEPEECKDTMRHWERCTRGMSDKHKTFLRGLQPYNGRDDPDPYHVTILSKLSNWDKHHDIHVAGHILRGASVEAEGNVGVEIVEFQYTEPIKDDAEIYFIRVKGMNEERGKMYMKIGAAFAICIDNPEIPMIHGLDIIDFLKAAHEYISTNILPSVSAEFGVIG